VNNSKLVAALSSFISLIALPSRLQIIQYKCQGQTAPDGKPDCSPATGLAAREGGEGALDRPGSPGLCSERWGSGWQRIDGKGGRAGSRSRKCGHPGC
uniref:Uncharacterized protein n=1 Tax=Bubo bubo TaxID=30461 RepID=A0A8C0FTL8_BUBBB